MVTVIGKVEGGGRDCKLSGVEQDIGLSNMPADEMR